MAKKVSNPVSNKSFPSKDSPTMMNDELESRIDGRIRGIPPTIQNYLSDLYASLDNLTTVSKSLCGKLVAVSTDTQPTPVIDEKVPMMSEIAMRIYEAVQRVNLVITDLNEAESRLQI